MRARTRLRKELEKERGEGEGGIFRSATISSFSLFFIGDRRRLLLFLFPSARRAKPLGVKKSKGSEGVSRLPLSLPFWPPTVVRRIAYPYEFRARENGALPFFFYFVACWVFGVMWYQSQNIVSFGHATATPKLSPRSLLNPDERAFFQVCSPLGWTTLLRGGNGMCTFIPTLSANPWQCSCSTCSTLRWAGDPVFLRKQSSPPALD